MDAPNKNASSSNEESQELSDTVADLDPQRFRRMQMNKVYAKRCRQKKQEYLQYLHNRQQEEEAKLASLSSQAALCQAQIGALQIENAELRQLIEVQEAKAFVDNAELENLKMEKNMLTYVEMMQKQAGQ